MKRKSRQWENQVMATSNSDHVINEHEDKNSVITTSILQNEVPISNFKDNHEKNGISFATTTIENEAISPTIGMQQQQQQQQGSRFHERILLRNTARMFRQRAILYLRQASHLERMSLCSNNAVSNNSNKGHSGDPSLPLEHFGFDVKRGEVIDLAKKSYESMVQLQNYMDSIMEGGLGGVEGLQINEHKMRKLQSQLYNEAPWKIFEKTVGKQIAKEKEYVRLKRGGKHFKNLLSNYILRRKLDYWNKLSTKEKENYLYIENTLK